MNWHDYQIEFAPDGSLRDIYVFETALSDWQKLVDFLRNSKYQCTFLDDNSEHNLPDDVVTIFDKSLTTWALLSVQVGDIILSCHFFSPEEIEFDFVPNEIKTQSEAEQIFDFMRRLGQSLNKEVVLTPENGRAFCIFKFSPASNELRYFPAQPT